MLDVLIPNIDQEMKRAKFSEFSTLAFDRFYVTL